MRVVPRAEWGARPPRGTQRHAPYSQRQGFVVHHNGPKMNVGDHGSCPGKVRGIQNYHMDDRGWSDIAYSFLLCPHGVIYECRGEYRQGANGRDVVRPIDVDSENFVTVMSMTGYDPALGPQSEEPATAEAKKAMAWLRDLLVWKGLPLRVSPHGTGPNQMGVPHNPFKYKVCPGVYWQEWVAWADGKPSLGEPVGPVVPPHVDDEKEEDMAAPDMFYRAPDGRVFATWGAEVRHVGPVEFNYWTQFGGVNYLNLEDQGEIDRFAAAANP